MEQEQTQEVSASASSNTTLQLFFACWLCMCVGCDCPQGLCANRKRSRGLFGWKVTKNKNKKPSPDQFHLGSETVIPSWLLFTRRPLLLPRLLLSPMRPPRAYTPPLCCQEHLVVPQMNAFSAVGLFYLRVYVVFFLRIWLQAVYNLSFLSDCCRCCIHVSQLDLSLFITLLQIFIFGDFGLSPVLVGLILPRLPSAGLTALKARL